MISGKRQWKFPRFAEQYHQEVDGMKQKKKPIVTDPFGSYTGRGKDPYEKPVQDADDL